MLLGLIKFNKQQPTLQLNEQVAIFLGEVASIEEAKTSCLDKQYSYTVITLKNGVSFNVQELFAEVIKMILELHDASD